MTSSYRPNYAGFGQIALSPEVRAALAEVAEKAKAIAERLAPDAPVIGEGYIASFEIREETETVAGHRRAVARLVNTSDHAAAVEWGNEHVGHPHRVLGRTLDALDGS